eukprot:4832853-Prymnesium_polylepis.1
MHDLVPPPNWAPVGTGPRRARRTFTPGRPHLQPSSPRGPHPRRSAAAAARLSPALPEPAAVRVRHRPRIRAPPLQRAGPPRRQLGHGSMQCRRRRARRRAVTPLAVTREQCCAPSGAT